MREPPDRADLKKHLHALGVPSDAYSLDGGHPHEAYVLDRRGDHWITSYSERGMETGAYTFDTESQACTHPLQRITCDLELQDAANTEISSETRH